MGQIADQILTKCFLFNFTLSAILQLIDHSVEGLFKPTNFIGATFDGFGREYVSITLSDAGFQSKESLTDVTNEKIR
ncbi:hypothetical protein D3C73_962830 [compost metagenome]